MDDALPVNDPLTGFTTPTVTTQATAAATPDTSGSSGIPTSGAVASYGNLRFPSDIDAVDNWMQITIFAYSRENRNSPANRQNKGTVTLPLPAQLATGYNASYESEEIGWIGTTKESLSRVIQKMGSKTGSIQDELNSGTAADWALQASGIARNIALDSNLGGSGASIQFGLAKNPHLAAVYRGNTFRRHTFDWKFMPRNAQETQTLANIMRVLKYAQAPALNATSGTHLLEYPDECEVDFHYPQYLFKIGPSVFLDISTNYHDAGQPAYFRSTHGPVAVSLRIELMETNIITKDTIQSSNL